MTYASCATKLFKTSHDEYGYSIRAALITKTILAQFKRDFPAYANDIECYDDQYPLLRFAEVSVNDLHEDYTWGPRYSSELSWKRIEQFCTPGSFISSFMIDHIMTLMDFIDVEVYCVTISFMERCFCFHGKCRDPKTIVSSSNRIGSKNSNEICFMEIVDAKLVLIPLHVGSVLGWKEGSSQYDHYVLFTINASDSNNVKIYCYDSLFKEKRIEEYQAAQNSLKEWYSNILVMHGHEAESLQFDLPTSTATSCYQQQDADCGILTIANALVVAKGYDIADTIKAMDEGRLKLIRYYLFFSIMVKESFDSHGTANLLTLKSVFLGLDDSDLQSSGNVNTDNNR